MVESWLERCRWQSAIERCVEEGLYNKSFQPTRPFVTALAGARPAPTVLAAEADVRRTQVRVKKPVWFLKQNCPDCGQGTSLVFVRCDRCGHLALICHEANWPAFPNPRDLTITANPEEACPNCGQITLAEFSNAASSDIQRAGFRPSDFST